MQKHRSKSIVTLAVLLCALACAFAYSLVPIEVKADDGGAVPILPINQQSNPPDTTISDTLTTSGDASAGQETTLLDQFALVIIELIY